MRTSKASNAELLAGSMYVYLLSLALTTPCESLSSSGQCSVVCLQRDPAVSVVRGGADNQFCRSIYDEQSFRVCGTAVLAGMSTRMRLTCVVSIHSLVSNIQ